MHANPKRARSAPKLSMEGRADRGPLPMAAPKTRAALDGAPPPRPRGQEAKHATLGLAIKAGYPTPTLTAPSELMAPISATSDM
eukprot:1650825-Alexandrium_andersonii.AAC.2